MAAVYKKIFLFILDGLGLAPRDPGNAVLAAGMPYLESLMKQYPAVSLAASGLVVGLPWGQQGSSEVGHSAIGTGRIIIQDLAHINAEIRSGAFAQNHAFLEALKHVNTTKGTLHLIGCTSHGGIHAHTDHLVALLELAAKQSKAPVALHIITDGQDSPPQDILHTLQILSPFIKQANGRIASIQGRDYAMDRIENWGMTERTWQAIALGTAPAIKNVEEYVKDCYAKGLDDSTIEPATVIDEGGPVAPVQNGDAVIFYNFRNDRIRQLAAPFILGGAFKSFDLVRSPENVKVVTMTKYGEEFNNLVAYPPALLPSILGEIISQQGWHQWRIAEKEKEAHVTNFFNGGRIAPFQGEQRAIVSSRMMHGAEYIEHPEMSIDKIVEVIGQKRTDDAALFVTNIANPDMIGHTGSFAASLQAIRVTDEALRAMIEPLRTDPTCAILITADHGNAEELIDPLTSGEDTQHSTRNVPLVLIVPHLKDGDRASDKLRVSSGASGSGSTGTQTPGSSLAPTSLSSLEALASTEPIGALVDIAPTILKLLGIPVPREMTGSPLI